VFRIKPACVGPQRAQHSEPNGPHPPLGRMSCSSTALVVALPLVCEGSSVHFPLNFWRTSCKVRMSTRQLHLLMYACMGSRLPLTDESSKNSTVSLLGSVRSSITLRLVVNVLDIHSILISPSCATLTSVTAPSCFTIFLPPTPFTSRNRCELSANSFQPSGILRMHAREACILTCAGEYIEDIAWGHVKCCLACDTGEITISIADMNLILLSMHSALPVEML
jgi:hypothetical protein